MVVYDCLRPIKSKIEGSKMGRKVNVKKSNKSNGNPFNWHIPKTEKKARSAGEVTEDRKAAIKASYETKRTAKSANPQRELALNKAATLTPEDRIKANIARRQRA